MSFKINHNSPNMDQKKVLSIEFKPSLTNPIVFKISCLQKKINISTYYKILRSNIFIKLKNKLFSFKKINV